MKVRCVAALAIGTLVVAACGGGGGQGGAASGESGSGRIKSMPAYPPASQASANEAKTDAPAKPKEPKEICAGATPIDPKASPKKKASAPSFEHDTLSFSKAKDVTYSMADLSALEKKSAWEEILSHAEDIPPAQRTPAWEKIVEKAAVGYVETLTTKASSWSGVYTSQAFIKRYPFLTKSQAFMAKRAEAAKVSSEQCLRGSYRGEHCIEEMQDFLKTPNTGADLGFEFGKITRRVMNHYVAVPFFKWAAEQKKDASYCADEDLKLATIAGLGLPADYENAAGARQLATDLCWDALKDAVRKELVEHPDGYYRDNACSVLSSKGAL